jgi:hypothetical protein
MTPAHVTAENVISHVLNASLDVAVVSVESLACLCCFSVIHADHSIVIAIHNVDEETNDQQEMIPHHVARRSDI